MIAVSVQTGDFDPGREQAALEASGGGAVASFTGLVRGEGGLVELHLDHYPAMTQKQLEALAEEAIDLLHCLADELELPWELNEEGKSAFSLRLEEKGARLGGSFQSPAGKKEIRLTKGEANKMCAQLTETEEKAAAIPDLPAGDWQPESPKPKWLWFAAGAALLAGGFLLWNSRPDHRAMKME